MSTAHIFYLPIIFVVGLLAGYFIGRVQADKELAERRKRARRRAAAERLKAKSAGSGLVVSGGGDEADDGEDAAGSQEPSA